MSKTYIEPSNTLPVYDECDVLVVGGGAAGHSAAVAAARAGANVIVMERYGYFGGDVTGAYVLLVPALNFHKHSVIRGVVEEWFTRMEKNAPETVIGPDYKYVWREDVPHVVDHYKKYEGCVNERFGPVVPVRSLFFEPTTLKLEMDAMVQEEKNIKALLHCWGTKPIVEDGKIKGVIFESKAGRQVIYAKVVIDATGDGDIYSQCAGFFGPSGINDYDHRDGQTSLVWRCGGVNYEAFAKLRCENGGKGWMPWLQELWDVAGYKTIPFTTGREGVLWFNNWILEKNCIDLEDIRETEFITRNSIRPILEFCKKSFPEAFANAYLYDIAPQLGVRGSRRLDGETIVTRLDFACNRAFDDVIAWHPVIGSPAPIEIPYSCMIPKTVDNLICPGRHLSADPLAIGALHLIPECAGTGQAAGVAAAVACADGSTTKTVDIKKVQKILCEEQDVPLPRQANTNKELVEELEAINYGRDTEFNKNIRQKAGLDW
ncbi:MAG: FAD-dependent oxidoreductase [Oscillospiraceae bacterium]|nr:FAD-dependent oxidoreductase [Oscillospiraceae bacterium]